MSLLLLVLMGLSACGRSSPSAPGDVAQTAVTVHPAVLGLGTEVEIAIDATTSSLAFGETAITLGPGVTVRGVTVHDGWGAVADVVVAPDAELGARDVVVTAGARSWTLPGAITVVPESITIAPDTAKLGQLMTVEVTGRATDFQAGTTWASFGQGVETIAVEVTSPTSATVQILVRADALPGEQDVSMEDGPERVTLYDGFTVDRVAMTAVFDPPVVSQGQTTSFRIDGKDTTFLVGDWATGDTGAPVLEGESEVAFWDDGGANLDISVVSMTVEDQDTITGTLRVSNAAALGTRDVFVSGFEDVLIADALTVEDTPPDLGAVAVGLGFDVYRDLDPVTGAVAEEVEAFAYFVIPLSPPCSQPPAEPPPTPLPFDINVAGPVPEPPEPVACPNPETVSAGDVVWLEGPENTVTLYKELIESTGQIIYLSRDLTLADYKFDTLYDLHTQGDPDGVPEVLLVDVQPTVPADYAVLAPQLWGGTSHDRATDLALAWTPASTFPTAVFAVGIGGTWEATGGAGLVAALPWDDGEHSFDASQLSQLAPGPVVFSFTSEIDGPRFGLPDSLVQTNKADSSVVTVGSLELR